MGTGGQEKRNDNPILLTVVSFLEYENFMRVLKKRGKGAERDKVNISKITVKLNIIKG